MKYLLSLIALMLLIPVGASAQAKKPTIMIFPHVVCMTDHYYMDDITVQCRK